MNFYSIITCRLNTFKRYLYQAGLLVLLILPGTLYAAGNCSPYLGLASLNEFFKNKTNMAYDATDFVEVKLLDPSLTSAIFSTWTIRICEQNLAGNNNDADGCSTNYSLSTFNTTNYPWITLSGNIGRYVNFKTGFDALLLDSNGDVIDYLTVDNYKPQEKAGCTGSALPYDYQASSPGASDKFIYRTPDGTGNWGSAASASAPPTLQNTNDTAPGGGTPPVVSVANVTVNKGQTATFTFKLEKTVSYPVSVDYVTFGGNAVADTAAPVTYDYVYKTGTVTFPANTTTLSQTIGITTNSVNPSTTDTVYFYLKLYNQLNATIQNSFPIGTILGGVSGEWYMDEPSWNNTTNQVSDSSGSTNHGTPHNNVSTMSPGKLCNAGSFDGVNDYIEIPHNSSLNGSTQLTYSAWISPTTWSGSTINLVMSKSVHGGGSGRAQMGIFSENNRLVGRAETAAGRYEVFTPLPTLSTWTHVALVFNSNSLTLYINGVAAPNVSATYTSSKIFNTTTLVQTTDPLMISKRVGSNQYYFHGLIDEVLVMQSALPGGFIKTMYDNYQLGLNWNGKARSCSGSLHHFEIIHDGAALTCNPEQVTVHACTNTSCTAPYYSSAVNVTLSPSGWVGGNSQPISSGLLTPSLAIRSASTQSLSITSSTVTPSSGLSATVCKNTSTGTSGVIGTASCNLTFSDSGFIIKNVTDGNTLIPTQLAGKNSDTGYHAKTLTLQAVQTSTTDATQCAPAFQGKTLNIDFAAECRDPVNCITGKKLTLNGSALVTNNDNAATGTPTYDTRSVTFDSNGNYDLVLNYPEAGLVELHARHNLLLADGTTPSGSYMTGSGTFVVRPLGFSLSGLAYATNASGTVFTQAGEPFITTLTAVAWQAADDTNNDGIPDTGATLTDNAITQNFGNEVSPVTPANVLAAHTTTMPNTGNLANPANSTSFTNGAGTKTLAWDEVGIINLSTTLSNYLSSGDDITGSAQDVGRFNPHHFDTVVTHGCSGSTFTYSGQPFTVTTFARNKAGTTTLNYRDTFAFGVTLSDANPSAPALGTFANNTIANASFTSPTEGTSTGAGITTNFAYTFNNKNTIPETIDIRATDINDTAISSSGFTEGSTEIRSGRIRLENVYGPELTPLTMPLSVEYYSDNSLVANTADDGYILNPDDSCSAYNAPGGTLANYAGNLNATNYTTANISGSGTVASGLATILFQAPGAGNDGSVNLLLNNIDSWLTYNWNTDCDNADGDNNISTGVDTGACGKASFGLYRGDDRVIYWHEVF